MELFLLILLGGLLRGIGYIVSKYISLGKGSSQAMALANSMIDTLISLPVGIYFMAKNEVQLGWAVLLLAIFSALIYGINLTLQYASLKRIEMSVMGIILRLNILFTAIFGVLLLGESLELWNVIGLLAILFGNILVVYKKAKLDLSMGILFALGAALFSALATFMDKVVLNSVNALFYVSLNNLLIMSTLIILKPKAAPESINLIRQNPKIFLLYSALITSAWFISSVAMQNMDVSRFSPVQKGITLIIPALFGIIFLHETGNLKQKLAGLALTVAGIVLMYV